jgi:uncharacterized protein YkwD
MNGPRSSRSAGAFVRPRAARILVLMLALLALSAAPAAARGAVRLPAPVPGPAPAGVPVAPPTTAGAARCPDGALPVAELSAARARAAIRCLLGHERSMVGAGALKPLRLLTRAAKAHTAAMVSGAWFGHVSPLSDTFRDRLRREGLAPRFAGETLAWGCGDETTPAHAVAGWLGSPPHRAVILSRRYTHSGVGFRRVAAPVAQCAPGVTWTLVVAGF